MEEDRVSAETFQECLLVPAVCGGEASRAGALSVLEGHSPWIEGAGIPAHETWGGQEALSGGHGAPLLCLPVARPTRQVGEGV